MDQITSPQNALYKTLKKLASSHKDRRRLGQTLVEGVHLTQSYLQHKGVPKRCVITEAALENKEVTKIIAECSAQGVDYTVLSNTHFKEISVVENGVGVAFVVEMPTHKEILEMKGDALLLDDLQDPGNVGTILRTAAAAGITQIYCSTGTASAWSPKVLRAGMGAQFVIDVYQNVNLEKLIQSSKTQVLAATLSGKKTIYETDLTKPTAWLIGNEGNGISRELLKHHVSEVIIPQKGSVESLNVAAAAAICLFEQARQLKYRLTE